MPWFERIPPGCRRDFFVWIKNMFSPRGSKHRALGVSFAVRAWWFVTLCPPRAGAAEVSQSPPAAEKRTEPAVHADKKNHWSFKAPIAPPVPEVKDKKWARNAIDNFVLARLEKENLRPAPEADRVTLIRRLSLDLTGLPPTIQEVDEFLAGQRADASANEVERLLSSPHLREQWSRHGLGLARYSA